VITDTITNASGFVTYAPAVDYLGNSPANLVTNELHQITNDGSTTYCYIVPSYGPFYANSLVVYSASAGVQTGTLTLGINYRMAFPFIGGSRATGLSLFGGIEFINPNFSGQVILQYRTLGGAWITTPAINAAILTSPVVNKDPQVITWEQLAPYTGQFPIVSAPWDRIDTKTMGDVNLAIEALRDGLMNKVLGLDLSTEISHMANFSNPHGSTAATVGLGNVANLKPATQLQANDNTNTTSYISAAELLASYTSLEYQATTSVAGLAALNSGANGGDDLDQYKALTASGLIALLSQPTNSFGGVVNRVQIKAQISPWTLPGSFTWQGTRYSSLSTFIAAVAAACGVSTLEYNSSTGEVWFPPAVNVPSLVTGA
jgi:hypothetical protein